jgi:cation:H+ antiporter
MTAALIQFVMSALVIIIAGTFLSRFADEIAERTGLGRLLIGSVLLAGATSLPELTVDISAVRAGMPDLAVGDLMGSSLFNLLILGILDLLSQTPGKMLSRQAARHALSGNVSVALTALVAIGLSAQAVLASGQWLGVSHGLWLVGLGYVFGVRLIYVDQRASLAFDAASGHLPDSTGRGPWGRAAAGFAVAAGAIVIAGPYLAEAAGEIATLSGLGKTFVGTTLVAFSTSLPELVTSLAALRRGAYDLVIGNVFGSNAFNMMLLIPIDMFHPGPLLAEVSSGHAVTGLAAILATMVVVLGQLCQIERKLPLIDPDAFLVIVIVFGALGLIYRMSG